MADQPQPPAHNLADPYGGRGPLIVRVTWAEASLGIVFMLLRTYTNAVIIKSFKWDYYWALIAIIIGLIAQSIITYSITLGIGNHMSILSALQLVKALKYNWIGQILGIHFNGFGKFAVIAFLLRIQDRAQSKRMTYLTYFLYFVGVSVFAVNITETAMILNSCSPAAKFWNPKLPGTCNHVVRTNHVGYFQGSWVATSDVVLAGYPILVFWNLKINLRVKIGLCLLMAGGVIAAVAGAMKTVYIKLIDVEEDRTYSIAPLIIWAFTEHWLVLILGTLPTLRPLFIAFYPGTLLSHSRSRGRYPSHGYIQQTDAKPIPLHTVKKKDRDSESEANILPSGGAGILRTTHVEVTSASNKSGDHSEESFYANERGPD